MITGSCLFAVMKCLWECGWGVIALLGRCRDFIHLRTECLVSEEKIGTKALKGEFNKDGGYAIRALNGPHSQMTDRHI